MGVGGVKGGEGWGLGKVMLCVMGVGGVGLGEGYEDC